MIDIPQADQKLICEAMHILVRGRLQLSVDCRRVSVTTRWEGTRTILEVPNRRKLKPGKTDDPAFGGLAERADTWDGTLGPNVEDADKGARCVRG